MRLPSGEMLGWLVAVCQARELVIEPIFEKQFAEHSYGLPADLEGKVAVCLAAFRPGRGFKDALRRVEKLLRAGNTYVVDVDIKGYFPLRQGYGGQVDAIPHDLLMAKVRERIADGKVLALIEGFLKQGVIEGNDWQQAKEEGTPQGGVISPLLANIYLDPLDWPMRDLAFLRDVLLERVNDDVRVEKAVSAHSSPPG